MQPPLCRFPTRTATPNFPAPRRSFPALEKAHGTILRTIKLTETSLIVCWCTSASGLLKTVAKGARRPKSPFAGKIDLFHEADIDIVRSRSGDLHILRDIAVTDHRHGIRANYSRVLAASYFVRLIEMATEPESPVRELHDLLHRALGFLSANDPTLRAVTFFEAELCRHLGIGTTSTIPSDTLGDVYGNLPPQRRELLLRVSP